VPLRLGRKCHARASSRGKRQRERMVVRARVDVRRAGMRSAARWSLWSRQRQGRRPRGEGLCLNESEATCGLHHPFIDGT
jgi:hypothetical protein